MFQTPPFLDFNLNLNLNNNLRISIIQQFIVVKMVVFIEFMGLVTTTTNSVMVG